MSEPTRDYIRDGAEIYRRSFATIRAEAALSGFAPEEERVAVRVIHACGMVDVAAALKFSPGAARAGIDALLRGASIFCDATMVADGVTRARLPRGNDVVCTLRAAGVADLAGRLDTTRSAAAVELWRDGMAGSVVAIGNAPTALFHLLDLIDAGAPRPALIVGMPVGFIGAAESKAALAERSDLAFIVVEGRRGGSAMAAAAVNALASPAE